LTTPLPGVFGQAFSKKGCVASFNHAVLASFSLKPFLKRLAELGLQSHNSAEV